jgi:hypothetical protein
MTTKPQKRLGILAIIILLALQGCSGDGTTSAEGEESSDPQGMEQVSPTSTPTDVLPTATPTDAPPTATPTVVSSEWGNSVTWLASDAFADTGLELQTGGDIDTEAVLVGVPQQQAHRTGNGEALSSDDGNGVEDYYMQFDIVDAFLHGGSPTKSVHIEVEYLDEGNDTFYIEYDGENDQGPFGDGRFTGVGLIEKTDSGEFKVAVFLVDDGFFANRNNDGDFRITDGSDGAEFIRRVTVKRIMPDSGLVDPILVVFYHEGDQLAPGQCTTLHWAVQNAENVSLNGDPVDPQGHSYECPQSTSTYVLQAWNANETVEEEITIHVSSESSQPQPYDMSVVCLFDELADPPRFLYYYYLDGPYPYHLSGSIYVDMFVDSGGSPELVHTILAPSHNTNFKYQAGDWDCCSISLRGNSDTNPGNDSASACR